MKFKDFFSKLKEQGKIKNEEYDKFLESIPDAEMPDTVFPVFESAFLTIDRAASDKSVKARIKSDLLDPIDNDLKTIMKHLPAEAIIEIERADSTYKKMELIREAIPQAIAKASKAPNDEEAKKKLQESQAAIHELTEKFTKLNSEREQEKKSLQIEYENKIKGFRLDTHLESLANSYTFADVFKDARPKLTKAILNEIKQKNKLDLVEKEGGLDIHILDENGAPRFEGNTPVTISSLLEPEFKPYLKVNNSEGQQQQNQQQQSFKMPAGGSNGQRGGANVSVQL